MADVADAIIDLEREIESDRKALAEKESALRLLKSRFGKVGAVVVAGQMTPHERVPTPDEPTDELFDLSSLMIEQPTRKRTFADSLRDALRRFGSQEFNIAHVEAAMKRLGVGVSGKTPRSRISATLSKLNEFGFLVKTFEGAGNIPNRYRVREFMSDAEVATFANMNNRKERDQPVDDSQQQLVATGSPDGL